MSVVIVLLSLGALAGFAVLLSYQDSVYLPHIIAEQNFLMPSARWDSPWKLAPWYILLEALVVKAFDSFIWIACAVVCVANAYCGVREEEMGLLKQ